jgi:hypothetical protein
MMRVQHSIVINRPSEDAFASDVNHLPEWAGTTIEVKDAPAGYLAQLISQLGWC